MKGLIMNRGSCWTPIINLNEEEKKVRQFKKSIAIFLAFLIAISGLASDGAPVSAAVNDYIQVTRQVNPSEISTEGEATVELTIQGTPPVSVVRPNDVILVIDKSGSMSGDKIVAARDSAKGFIDLMNLSVHRVGIVDYSSQNNVKVFPLTDDATEAKAYVDTIVASGGTATGRAIEVAAAELLREPREGAQPVIVLMTDGDATEPSGSAYQFALDKANETKEQGIVFYTIALLNANDNPDTSGPNNLLKKMATTFTHHHFVLGSVGLKDIYAAIVKEIGVASAYNVVVSDYVGDKFEIVPDSYLDNIPQPVVSGNEISWSFLELKNNTLKFTYKIRPKSLDDTGTFNVATTAANVNYMDFAGAVRDKSIPNRSIKVKFPAPIITEVVESSGHPAGGNEVIIYGDKFRDGARVYFNNIESSAVTYMDQGTLKVIVPAGKQGTASVKVVNPDGQNATSSYQYITDPEVTSYTPQEGTVEGNTVVTFSGDYFLPGIVVKFGENKAGITTQRANYLAVKTPAAAEAGEVDIVLLNPDGTSLTIPAGFKYTEAEKPKLEVLSLAPDNGLPAGGETVYINGKLIDPLVKVYFGANEASVSSILSSDRIQVISPPGDIGKVDITLQNPDGQEATLSQAYTYALPDYPEPVVKSITPNLGETTGGNIAYIAGNNFVAGVKVLINNVPAEVTATTATRLTVVVPASSTEGTFDVTVVNPDNKEAVLPASYTYILPPPPPAPILTSITPNNGLTTGNAGVMLKGENFVDGSVVLFNNVEIPTTFVSSKQLNAVTPEWAQPESVNVTVKNPDDQHSNETLTYTYNEPQPEPVSVTLVNPDNGLTTGGDIVYLTGTGFQRGIKVFFGDVEAEVKTYTSSRRISVTTPSVASPQTVDVRVLNPDNGTDTLPAAYTYTLTRPTITSLSPSSGPKTGGTALYINGTNFEPTMSVSIDGIDVPIDSFVNNTRVKVTTPPSSTAGDVPLVITLLNGESASSMFKYEEPALGPAPVLKLLNVTSGPSSGGGRIYLTGSNFERGSRVFFDGVESTTVSYTSTIRISAVVPAGTGVVQVKVMNSDGQESNTVEYTYK